MYDKRNHIRFISLILPILLVCFLLTPPRALHAQEVELNWEIVTEMDAAGETALAITSTLPASISAYEVHVTYNPEQIEILDVQDGNTGRSPNFTNADGALVLRAEDEGTTLLTAGQAYTLAKLRLKVKVKEATTITLARSTFIDADGDELNGTMLLNLILPAPGSSPSSTQTETSASSGQSVSSISNSAAQSGSDGTSPLSSPATSSGTGATAEPQGLASRNLKLVLALASLVLIIAIIVLLRRNKNRR